MTRAFVLRDLTALLVTLTILGSIMLAALGETRRHARLGEDLASLNRFASATGSYAADNDDALWSFNWDGGETYLMMTQDGELVPTQMPVDDIGAGARQAVHLMRAIGGRIGPNGMPTINSWIPHPNFSILPLLDYLGEDPLATWTTSAADDIKQRWKDDPVNKFDAGEWLPLQPDPTALSRRWPYSSGFKLSPAVWDHNQSELAPEFESERIQSMGTHNSYTIPSNPHIGDRMLSDVVYPAGKVVVYDTHQRHFGSRMHYVNVSAGADSNEPPARVPVLVFDGSAAVRSVADSNPGWRPRTSTFPCMTYWYQPQEWEIPTTNGEFQQFSKGFFRWTRGGLKGVDFGALPLDTGQPEPGVCDF